ncbi:TPA: CHASE2 domain-containing protein [bacterium]|nr:CHASE2 domain-containing protein [bacterium]
MIQKQKSVTKGVVISVVALTVAFVFSLLSLLEFWEPVEYSLYDMFLKIKPSIKEDPSLLIIDVDEKSIIEKGDWPWPRSNIAKILEILTLAKAKNLVFDIEFLETSPMSVNRQYLQEGLPLDFSITFADIGDNIEYSFSMLKEKQTTIDEIMPMLIDSVLESKNNLLANTFKVAVANDIYLGQAMRLFGYTFTTLNLQKEFSLGRKQTPELKEYAKTHFSYKTITGTYYWKIENKDFLVPIPEVSENAQGAGFTNVTIDKDGTRRRIKLVEKIDDAYYLQLAMRPLVFMLGDPTIELKHNAIVIHDVMLDGQKTTITIPVDKNGNMLINWPKKTYKNSFDHISAIEILDIADKEDDIFALLQKLRTSKLWSYCSLGYEPIETILSAYNTMAQSKTNALETGEGTDKHAWISDRTAFYAMLSNFVKAGYAKEILSVIDSLKAPTNIKQSLNNEGTTFNSLMEELEKKMQVYNKNYASLMERLKDKFCIIGWSATATTDIGVNPFEERYINIGTHAAVVNTILNRKFIQEAPLWLSAILSIILGIAVTGIVILLNEHPTLRVIFGLIFIIICFILVYLLFLFSGVFIKFIAPALSAAISYFSTILISIIFSEREKSFIKKAFGTYLSKDIIKEIIGNPAMLRLGGEQKYITALFTDVKGFSTISEQLSPEELVYLLNIYLSKMSDIILENQGTIDKFEGDAIISFFGAPVWNEFHARNACISAIRMKQAELELNKYVLENKISPNPLLTRIGINTGDMVVGNMGTEQKMNYTIMGNAVNLAARLEGVNKQYGSWILISQETYEKAGSGFIVREFDRVRVVGITTPVRLYELVGLDNEMPEDEKAFISQFNKAHDLFEQKLYKESREAFKELLAIKEDDAPSKTYLGRCENFIKNPPRQDWDGVFNLTEK